MIIHFSVDAYHVTGQAIRMRLACFPYWPRGWLFSLFCGVDSEGTEPVVVGCVGND